MKHGKVKKHSSRKHISNSQKEERKKKLKELATKLKESDNQSANLSTSSTSKSTLNVKITNSNRGAFLTDTVQVVKPVKRKVEKIEKRSKNKSIESPNNENKDDDSQSPEDRENKKNQSSHSKSHSSKRKEHKSSKNKKETKDDNSKNNSTQESSKLLESRVPLKSLKPLTGSDETVSGKPFSKVDPMPPKKTKKQVRFSEASPDVRVFEIEPGNQMKKTSSVRNSLVDVRQPVFSLEKITLMKILRWNPNWLEEQINNNDPPPILGHNNPPMSIFHSFVNHNQYVQ